MFSPEQKPEEVSFFSVSNTFETFYDNEIGPDGRPLPKKPEDAQFNKVGIRYFNEAGTMSPITIANMEPSEIAEEIKNMVAYLQNLEGKRLSDYTRSEISRAIRTSESVLRERDSKLRKNPYYTNILAEYADSIRRAFDKAMDIQRIEQMPVESEPGNNNVIPMRRASNG